MRTLIFDFETTGLDTKTDRIIQIGLKTGGKEKCILIDPGTPIPATATEVHGITDADVKGKPTFKSLAEKLHRIFTDTVLIGFGIKRFDIPLLAAEFSRCGIAWDPSDQPIVDCVEIFHTFYPRDLSAALKTYCGQEHTDAHDALADVLAVEKVLEMQLAAHYENATSLEDISKQFNPAGLGWDGKLKMKDDKAVLTFGKHRGKTLAEVAKVDKGWLEWTLDKKVFCKTNERLVLEVL